LSDDRLPIVYKRWHNAIWIDCEIFLLELILFAQIKPDLCELQALFVQDETNLLTACRVRRVM
jgi:hypothetical protein